MRGAFLLLQTLSSEEGRFLFDLLGRLSRAEFAGTEWTVVTTPSNKAHVASWHAAFAAHLPEAGGNLTLTWRHVPERPVMGSGHLQESVETDFWLAHRPDSPAIPLLTAPVLALCGLDMSTGDPLIHGVAAARNHRRRMQANTGVIARYLCFSHATASRLQERYGIPEGRIEVLTPMPRPATDPLEFEGFRAGLATHLSVQAPVGSAWRTTQLPLWAAAASWQDIRYFLLETRDRPTDNALVVLKALRALNRGRRRDVKLVLTCPLPWDAPETSLVLQYIREHQMYLDAISLPNLPPPLYSYLVRHAAGVISPAPYEDGLPAAAVDAMALGAPFVVARAFGSEEFFEPGEEAFCFPPTDVGTLADRMEALLDQRDALLAAQRPLAARQEARTARGPITIEALPEVGNRMPTEHNIFAAHAGAGEDGVLAEAEAGRSVVMEGFNVPPGGAVYIRFDLALQRGAEAPEGAQAQSILALGWWDEKTYRPGESRILEAPEQAQPMPLSFCALNMSEEARRFELRVAKGVGVKMHLANLQGVVV